MANHPGSHRKNRGIPDFSKGGRDLKDKDDTGFGEDKDDDKKRKDLLKILELLQKGRKGKKGGGRIGVTRPGVSRR